MVLLSERRADGLTSTNFVDRPTTLNIDGPGAGAVAAVPAMLEAPEPELPPCEAKAAHPEKIAATNKN